MKEEMEREREREEKQEDDMRIKKYIYKSRQQIDNICDDSLADLVGKVTVKEMKKRFGKK